MTPSPQRNARKMSAQSRLVRASLLLKWTDTRAFSVCWGSYQINLEHCSKKVVTRIGKKLSLTSVAPCSSQGFASGIRGKSWHPDSGRISLLKTERLSTRIIKEGKRNKRTTHLLNVEIHSIFYRDIVTFQINGTPSASVPKLQRKQRKCQITRLLGFFMSSDNQIALNTNVYSIANWQD